MLPGFGGHLVSELFLESQIAAGGAVDTGLSGIDEARRVLSRWREKCRLLGPASSVRALFEAAAAPLADALGFEAPTAIVSVGRVVSSTIHAGADPVVLIAAPWAEPLDRLWRIAVTEAAKRSAAWSVVFNGTHVRSIDAARLYTKRFVEFDLELTLDMDRTFAAFWLLMRASAFFARSGGQPARLRTIADASERHASAVCHSLRDGVLTASAEVLGALIGRRTRRAPRLPPDGGFEQALTIVYRMLFLLFAEARGLVPLWHPIYRDSYSLEALRAAAEQPGPARGLWDALRATARLAHAGCRVGDLRVTPFNGRLFAPSRTPLADRRHLDDEAARRAVLALSTRRTADGAGRERIGYRDLGVEQLGAVYETLLDYEPRLGPRVSLERSACTRKATGSFYTPQPIAEYLVRRTLGPLVRAAAEPDDILRLRIVDPAMGSGAFLVAACRYLAAAYEAALVERGGYRATDVTEAERASIRRRIAERCLYGVDSNPMAVQLARLSLWLATLAHDRPLTFLDHHLQHGDSLVGVWLTNIRRAPAVGMKRPTARSAGPSLFDERDVSDAVTAALPVRFTLESVPDDTVEQVHFKERALAEMNRHDAKLSRWKRIADLWCAIWLAPPDMRVPPAAFGPLSDAILTGVGALPPHTATAYLETAAAAAKKGRFFHWELEFPEVFFDAGGARRTDAGFDAVIGNPPWDMLRADGGSAGQEREDLRALLRFTREAGVYIAQSSGQANRYQLFVERTMSLVRPGGRLGLVLPSGFGTDHGSAALRRRLLTSCDVDALVGFDNQRGVFPIHRSVRFLVLTAEAGSPTRSIACRFGERDPEALGLVDDRPADTCDWFSVRMTPSLIERLSGHTLTIPELRTEMDLRIAERAAALFPRLGDQDGWGLRFGRELNATDDRRHFKAPGEGLPVIEGKQIKAFQVDVDGARLSIPAATARRLIDRDRYERPRLAYRDVASATNRRTLIASILPARCLSTHTVYCLRTRVPLQAQHILCGLFNSFVVNYLIRLRVTTHVTTASVEGLPIPTRDSSPSAFRTIAFLARRLSRGPDADAAAQLEALVARLYQISAEELEHVLDTFPLVPREERDRARRAHACASDPH